MLSARAMSLLCGLLIPYEGSGAVMACLERYFSPVDIYPASRGDYNLRALLPLYVQISNRPHS